MNLITTYCISSYFILYGDWNYYSIFNSQVPAFHCLLHQPCWHIPPDEWHQSTRQICTFYVQKQNPRNHSGCYIFHTIKKSKRLSCTCLASSRCSRVCGIAPSVAATTRIAPSIWAVPVIIFWNEKIPLCEEHNRQRNTAKKSHLFAKYTYFFIIKAAEEIALLEVLDEGLDLIPTRPGLCCQTFLSLEPLNMITNVNTGPVILTTIQHLYN